mmetsp:Transcript_58585/g.136855  ORF Transcript_58585/g.136855 Transcript_58585/m.136855 type:complete len:352 (+) Transcript_58585:103-1158(+)
MRAGEFRVFVRTEGRGIPLPDDQALRSHFAAFGEILDLHQPIRSPDICYVTFGSESELTAALQQPSVSIGGTLCSVQMAAPRGELGLHTAPWPSEGLAAQRMLLTQAGFAAAPGVSGVAALSGTDRKRLYVTGVPPGTPDVDALLRDYFALFGEVCDVYIPMDYSTGLKKPFAFITMANSLEVENILIVSPHRIAEGIEVGVTLAEPKDGKGAAKPPSRLQASPAHAPVTPSPMLQAYGPSSCGKGLPPAGKGTAAVQGVSSPFRLFVAGVPQGLNADMMRGHFARHGEILDIYVPPRHPEIAYITFSTYEEVEDAVTNSGLRIAGYWVKAVEAAEERPGMKGKGFRTAPY